LNNGNGVFSAGGSLAPFASQFRAVALGDVDGDGDLDAFIGGVFGDEVWLNDGAGNFSNSGQSLGSSDTFAVALGDLDGDGDLDAFVGSSFGTPGDLDVITGEAGGKVWRNEGGLTFQDAGTHLASLISDALALGDVRGLGRVDIVQEAGTLQVWWNINPVTCRQDCVNYLCVLSCIATCSGGGLAGRLVNLVSAIDLPTFYALRDNVLAHTPAGQHFIDLFYTHDAEILKLLIANPTLWDEGVAALQLWQPGLQALVNGQGSQLVISAQQVRAVQNFLSHLSAAGSPALQQAIAAELATMPPLETFTGMTMERARGLLVEYRLSLPIVYK
jgi:FG-GAP-like repeat